jgi:hypothetical protein
MATLKDLTETLARAAGLPEATAFAYGRFARESGHISQYGRGNNAAQMTLPDATNLLIATGGTNTTREAGSTITLFRRLRLQTFSYEPIEEPFLNWLRPLGIGLSSSPRTDFGSFLDFLLEELANGGLRQVCRLLPGNPRFDVLPTKSEIGLDIDLVIQFERTNPIAEISFRKRYQPREIFSFHFHGSPLLPLGMEVTASIPVTTSAALAYCVSKGPLPKQLKTPVQIDQFLFPTVVS